MASGYTNGLNLAAKEHLASGKPLTRLEAIVLYGVSNLTALIAHMKDDGWSIQKRNVPYARAVVRINEYATLQPPKNLPTRDIQLVEYWISK